MSLDFEFSLLNNEIDDGERRMMEIERSSKRG